MELVKDFEAQSKDKIYGHTFEVYDQDEFIGSSFVMHEDEPEWILSHVKHGMEVRKCD